MLGRCYFVVLRLGRNAHLPEFFVYLAHIGGNSLADGTKVMVVQLLSLGRHSAEQRASGIDQIFALQIFLPVDQEILLLCSD